MLLITSSNRANGLFSALEEAPGEEVELAGTKKRIMRSGTATTAQELADRRRRVALLQIQNKKQIVPDR